MNPTREQLDAAPWMRVARGELGQAEVPGPGNNPRILRYIASCDRGTRPWLARDSTPHCSGFVNYCMELSNLPRTRKLNARSWIGYGEQVQLNDIRYGDILVLWRGLKVPASIKNAPAHVTFFDRWAPSKTHVFGHGGNQKNRVGVDLYDWERVIWICRPNAADIARVQLERVEA